MENRSEIFFLKKMYWFLDNNKMLKIHKGESKKDDKKFTDGISDGGHEKWKIPSYI